MHTMNPSETREQAGRSRVMLDDKFGIERTENGMFTIVDADGNIISDEDFLGIDVYDVSPQPNKLQNLVQAIKQKCLGASGVEEEELRPDFFVIGTSDNREAVEMDRHKAMQWERQQCNEFVEEIRKALESLILSPDISAVHRFVQDTARGTHLRSWIDFLSRDPRLREQKLRTLILSSEGFTRGLPHPLRTPYFDQQLGQCTMQEGAYQFMVHPLTGEKAHEQGYHSIEREGSLYYGIRGASREEIRFFEPLPKIRKRELEFQPVV